MTDKVTVQDVVDLAREILGCSEPNDDPLAPIFIDATSWTSKAVAQVSNQLSLRPGSGIIHALKSTSTFMRAISGIRNLSVIEICSVLYSEWTGRDGVTKLGPNPGYLRYRIFLYSVSSDVVAKLQYELATRFASRLGGRISTIYYPVLITVCASFRGKAPIIIDKRKRNVHGDLNAFRRLKVVKESAEIDFFNNEDDLE